MSDFDKELENLINRHSKENDSNTPDWILGQYLSACLAAWNTGVQQRENWYGRATQCRAERAEAERDRLREALEEAASSLEALSTAGAHDSTIEDLIDVRGYAGSRAREARAALTGGQR